MKKVAYLSSVLALGLFLGFCSKQEEISPERFQVLIDTLSQDLGYEEWQDFAYELVKNYPEEYASAMILVQASERALMERDEKGFDRLFKILETYPEQGMLETGDQIAVANRLAWIMVDQMIFIDRAPKVIDHAVRLYEAEGATLQWSDELGSMIYDTRALIYEKTGDMDKALEAYTQSLEYYEQPETLIRRGLLYEGKEDLDAALEDYIAALSHSPGNEMILNKVKVVYSTLNEGEDAEAFIVDLQLSLLEKRKEEVLAEAFFQAAPVFSFTDFDGRLIDNASILGKVVFVDFWATWCNPCRRELPEFQKFYDQHKDNPKIVFVAASTDVEKDKVRPYLAAQNYTFPVAFAEENAANFGVEGIPSLFIIGPEGNIRYKIVGFDPDKDFIREMTWRLESLLDY